MLYLTKGGLWLVLSQGVALISGLALSVAFANLVSKEVYGNYKFVIAVAGALSAITLTGLPTAITQAVARGFEGVLRDGFKSNLKWSAGFALATLGVSIYYFVNGNSTIGLSLLIAGAFLPFYYSFVLYGAFLAGKKDFGTSTKFNIFRTTFSAAALIATILLTDNIVIIILVYYLSITLPVGVFYLRTLKNYQPNEVTTPETLSYSKHLSLMGILTKIANQLDTILLFHYVGAADLAVYAFALAMPDQIRNLNKVIGTLILPKLSKADPDNLRQNLKTKMFFFFSIMAVIAILYALAAPFIFKFFFPKYLGSVIYSQVYVLTILLMPSIFFQQSLVAYMKKKQLYVVNVITPVTKIVLWLVLLPLYGIWGGIATLLLTRTVNLAILLYFFKTMR